MKEFTKLTICIFLVFFISCKENEERTQKEEDISFRFYNLENQGWRSKMHSQKIENLKFTATEVPIQYYLLKEIGNNDLVKIDSIYENNKRERIIEFSFEDDKGRDLLEERFTLMDYETSVKYMSFSIEKDFYVISSNKDTIRCTGSLFERNFKVGSFNKVLLFFSDINPNDNIKLIYHDKLFKKGTIKFNLTDPVLKL